MSLAGSSVSITVDSGIRLGSGIWTMTPGDERVGVEPLDLGADLASRRRARDLDEATLDADLRARLEDLVEVDRRRRVPPDDEDREPGRVAVPAAERGDVGARRVARISAAIGAPSRSLGPVAGCGRHSGRTSIGSRDSPLRTTSLRKSAWRSISSASRSVRDEQLAATSRRRRSRAG